MAPVLGSLPLKWDTKPEFSTASFSFSWVHLGSEPTNWNVGFLSLKESQSRIVRTSRLLPGTSGSRNYLHANSNLRASSEGNLHLYLIFILTTTPVVK